MATYKVIQDIEAEDKLLGPLTLRQFIYALIAAACLYFCFLALTKGATFLLIIFAPPALFCGFFAFPFGRDQPTEVWALAKIRFLLKPRKRIWDQSGIKELVTITVPKKIERVYSDGLSQTEVRSRLHALADTIDSRGWAIKNVNVNLYNQPAALSLSSDADDDRLINPNNIPQPVPSYDVQASDDILDVENNPVAQQFSQMIDASSQSHRQQIMNKLAPKRAKTKKAASATKNPPADYWFLNQPSSPARLNKNDVVFANPKIVPPGADDQDDTVRHAPSEEERALASRIRSHKEKTEHLSYGHMHAIDPEGPKKHAPEPSPQGQPNDAAPMTTTPDPAILNLANNNDLNVSTIARQANKTKGGGKSLPDDPDNEVVISLH